MHSPNILLCLFSELGEKGVEFQLAHKEVRMGLCWQVTVTSFQRGKSRGRAHRCSTTFLLHVHP